MFSSEVCGYVAEVLEEDDYVKEVKYESNKKI